MPMEPRCTLDQLLETHRESLEHLVLAAGDEPREGLPLPAGTWAARAWAWRMEREAAAGIADTFLISSRRTEPVGVLRLERIQRQAGTAFLSYWIAPGFRRQGFASAAGRQGLAFAEERRRFTCLKAWTTSDNLGSRGVLNNLSFREVPPLRVTNAKNLGFEKALNPPATAIAAFRRGQGSWVLRPEQLQVLAQLPRRQLAHEVAREARQRFPHRLGFETQENLRRRIYGAIQRAWGYGLREERELRAFALLTVTVHPTFDQYPSFLELFRGQPTPGGSLLDALFQTATPEHWQEAAAQGEGGQG